MTALGGKYDVKKAYFILITSACKHISSRNTNLTLGCLIIFHFSAFLLLIVAFNSLIKCQRAVQGLLNVMGHKARLVYVFPALSQASLRPSRPKLGQFMSFQPQSRLNLPVSVMARLVLSLYFVKSQFLLRLLLAFIKPNQTLFTLRRYYIVVNGNSQRKRNRLTKKA